MKIRIKSGECPSYLTVGKVYETEKSMFDGLYYIKSDDSDFIYINLEFDGSHLNGGSWERVDE